MLSRLQLYGLLALGFMLGLIGIYSAGVMRGQDKVKRKLDQKRIDNLTTQKEIENELDALSDTSLSDRATEWVRKDNE
ncbi:MAG: hypothetical protein CMF29_08560 [Kiritimatiellaceae bacterium]|jgi:hypothetical protein|nr:hypothetical protein [Kiritimatiellaceae bacterium]|tara:strand:+ start:107 stop:340 length:234 start_codon:yes stop_codon:yes gene_type:complete